MQGAQISLSSSSTWAGFHEVVLQASLPPADYLEPGWTLQWPEQRLPTFTTSRPSTQPGRKPAGLQRCTPEERVRWEEDAFRFPPYQYRNDNCLRHRSGRLRVASLIEREVIMGLPAGYTQPCWPKSQRTSSDYNDARLSLVGNAWCVQVVAWIIGCLTSLLGLSQPFTPQQVVQACRPGGAGDLQRLLVRPPVRPELVVPPADGVHLVRKLAGLVSIKGEDIMLHSSTEQQVKYQRLRASLRSKLWRWKTIAGWTWRGSLEHINVLEMRAIYTTVRWWVSQAHASSCRFVHLTDSLVCLHALSRGRSSSRKIRRTLAKLNSYLLVCNLHPLWAFVRTNDNPADAPSRRKVRKKWVK